MIVIQIIRALGHAIVFVLCGILHVLPSRHPRDSIPCVVAKRSGAPRADTGAPRSAAAGLRGILRQGRVELLGAGDMAVLVSAKRAGLHTLEDAMEG
jgi:hypothetical protein